MINNSQETFVLIGSKNSANTRTSVALTSAYQAENGSTPTKSFSVGGYNRINFYALYTMGATETGNSVQFRVDVSPDGTNWYALANDAASGGTSTLTAREFTFTGADASTATISIILDIGYEYMRIAAKETGVATNAGSVFVEATFSAI